MEILDDLVIEQRQSVSNAENILRKPQFSLHKADTFEAQSGLPVNHRTARDRELRPADFLTAEKIGHRLDRGPLIIEIRLKVKLHAVTSETADTFPVETVLLENRGQVRLRNIVIESVIAKIDMNFTRQELTPSAKQRCREPAIRFPCGRSSRPGTRRGRRCRRCALSSLRFPCLR